MTKVLLIGYWTVSRFDTVHKLLWHLIIMNWFCLFKDFVEILKKA